MTAQTVTPETRPTTSCGLLKFKEKRGVKGEYVEGSIKERVDQARAAGVPLWVGANLSARFFSKVELVPDDVVLVLYTLSVSSKDTPITSTLDHKAEIPLSYLLGLLADHCAFKHSPALIECCRNIAYARDAFGELCVVDLTYWGDEECWFIESYALDEERQRMDSLVIALA